MAKNDKEDKKETKKADAPTFKYGVEDIADALGIKAASARVQLRNHGIEKAGKSYGWNSKSELEDVIKELKADAKSEKKSDKKSEKKSEGKKTSKMTKKSKVKDEEPEEEVEGEEDAA